MDPLELEQKVRDEIKRTVALIDEYRAMTKPVVPDTAVGRISRMDAINNKSVNEAALRLAVAKLESLKQVLSRAGTSDFGLCSKCRQPIPAGRILARPESLYCVRCAR